jgi:hypothetical protein
MLIGCVYKTGLNIKSKDGIGLAVFKAFRGLLLAVRFFRLRLTVLLGKLLNGFSLDHTGIYGAHKQTHNKEKEIKVLPLSSSNQEKFI